MYIPPAQIECISNVIYNEARGETIVGQQAVGHVILNRSKKYNELPCIIVKRRGQFKYKSTHYHKHYELPEKDPTFGALYFASNNPKWKYHQTVRIGGHRFYK